MTALLCIFGTAAAESFDDSAVKHISYPDWFKDSPFNDVQEDLNQALVDGKQGLMLLFTTEGCAYCDAFIRRSLGDPEIASLVQKDFDALGFEIFDDAEMTGPRGESLAIKQFAENQGVQFAPTLLFIGAAGEPTLRVVGYQSLERFRAILGYIAGGHHRTTSLRDYLAHSIEKASSATANAELKDDPLFARPPHRLDRSRSPASRPLLVLFEERGCAACADFHRDVLASNEIREVLRHFEVVRLDSTDDRTSLLAPDGARVTPAAWFGQAAFTRVPALLFFDEKGNEVLKTDALILRQRMMNSLSYVLERAYEQGWSYQRFARTKGLEKRRDGTKSQ